jgi:hypothetical protein
MIMHNSIVKNLVFNFPLDSDVLHRLETDDRMKKAMNILVRHTSREDQRREIIRRAAAAKTKAEITKKSVLWPGKWKSEAEKVNGAISDLRGRLGPYAMQIPEDTPAGQNFRKLAEGLDFAEYFINEVVASKQKALAAAMTKSRKKNEATIIFCKILCAEIFEMIGQPLCEFVAIACPVAFGVKAQMPLKNVEAAWSNEKENRATDRNT